MKAEGKLVGGGSAGRGQRLGGKRKSEVKGKNSVNENAIRKFITLYGD